MNTHEKPFVLAKPPTPEEIVQETTRKMAPEIRRAVNSLKMPMAVKGFFSALLDYTFLYSYGGSGRGKIFISIKDLARLLRHNKDTITAWRDKLVLEKLIWVRESWPKSEWRICAMCPPPVSAYDGSEADFIRGKAAALEAAEMAPDEQSGNLPLGGSNGGNVKNGPNSEDSSDTKRKPSDSVSETFRLPVRSLPLVRPKDSPLPGGNLPPTHPTPSDSVSEASGHNGGNLRPDSPKVSATQSEAIPPHRPKPSAAIRSLPKEKRSKGGKGGGDAPAVSDDERAFKKWEVRLDDMRNSDLRKLSEITAREFQAARGTEARELAQRKLAAVRLRLLGPSAKEKPARETPAAGPKPKAAPIPVEKRRELMAKARKDSGV